MQEIINSSHHKESIDARSASIINSSHRKESFDARSASIINGHDIEYRYKLLFSLSNDTSVLKCYTRYLFLSFMRYKKNRTLYRILSSQYLLSTRKKRICNITERILKKFILDDRLDYDLRADASDVLIRLGSPESKELGREAITLLGREFKENIYSNKQNVHVTEISESIQKFINEISSINIDGVVFEDIISDIEKIYRKNPSYEDIKTNNENNKRTSNWDRVKSSLLRISIDKMYYNNHTLSTLFKKIWKLVSNSSELKKRLIEELIDMADTCSTGHISRLCNVISGFNVNMNGSDKIFNIDIGFKEQIKMNILVKIQYKIEDIKDEEYKEKLLNEFISSSSFEDKNSLKLFFRDHLNDIITELKDEFVPQYLPLEKFEEYVRESISLFELGK